MLRSIYNTVRQVVLAAGGKDVKRPSSGRVFMPDKTDLSRDYVSIGLTPAKLVTLLKDFDAGDLGRGFELAEQMEEKDSHIASVAQTRRLAITGLDWEIVSAADIDEIDNRTQADNAAAFCAQVLRGLTSFDLVLEHLALAIGRNLSVAELVWGPDGLEDLAPLPHTRLIYKTDGDAPELRVLTKEDAVNGVSMDPAKWICHTPQTVAGIPMRGGLLRMTAAAYVAKAYALKDWMTFCELFGMPIRLARYEPGASAEEKAELLRMLSMLGTDAAAVFSKAVEIDLKESGKQGESPYERIAVFFNAEMSKAWLGQTLTTEVGASGSRALGDVHNEVRHDLLDADIRAEGRTIRRDLLTWLTQFELGPDCPVPYFRRVVHETRDPQVLSTSVKSAVELGVMVDRKWFSGELGLQTTEKADEALTAPSGKQPGIIPLSDRNGTNHTLVLSDADQSAVDAYVDSILPQASLAHGQLLNTVGEWIDAAIAAGISTPAGVSGFIADQVASGRMPVPQDLADLMANVITLGKLQGRIRVDPSGRMAQLRSRTIKAKDRSRSQLVLAANEFVDLPFGEAIAAMAERVRMTRPAFDELSREAKSKAFTVAWVDSVRMLADIHEAMLTSLATGETLHDFRTRLPEMSEQMGWTGERPWHADLVFRQQGMMATQAGRFDQMADAGITHWQYSSLMDSRVRPEHAALDGKVFAINDRTFYPPWDFNCRCVAEPVFEEEIGDRLERSEDLLGQQVGSDPETGEPIRLQLPSGEHPFEWDPASFAARTPVSLNVISEPLRTAIGGLLKDQGIDVAE